MRQPSSHEKNQFSLGANNCLWQARFVTYDFKISEKWYFPTVIWNWL